MIANLRSPQSLCPSVNNSPDHTVHDADPLRAALRFELPAGPNWFSAGMYAVHGYRTAETAMVVAGPCRLLAHAHPEDRAAFAKAWRRMQGGAGPVTLRYRVVGADGCHPTGVRRCQSGVAPGRDGNRLRSHRTRHHPGHHPPFRPTAEIDHPPIASVARDPVSRSPPPPSQRVRSIVGRGISVSGERERSRGRLLGGGFGVEQARLRERGRFDKRVRDRVDMSPESRVPPVSGVWVSTAGAGWP